MRLIVLLLVVLFITGCTTPNEVQQAAAMIPQAAEMIVDLPTGDNASLVTAKRVAADVKKMGALVSKAVGPPAEPAVYSVGQIDTMVAMGNLKVDMQNAVKSQILALSNSLPGQIKSIVKPLIPAPPKPQRFPVEEILAGFAAVYGTFKGAGFAARKIAKNKKKLKAGA